MASTFDEWLDELPERPAWMASAACHGLGAARFLPTAPSATAQRDALDAGLAICSPCPVRSECLAYAVETASVGIWGGEYLADQRATRRASPTRPTNSTRG